jgi:hypothetical protein
MDITCLPSTPRNISNALCYYQVCEFKLVIIIAMPSNNITPSPLALPISKYSQFCDLENLILNYINFKGNFLKKNPRFLNLKNKK